MARLHRSFLTVIAPREGVVAKLTAREGQFVQTGQPLVQLVPSPTAVVANFKETQLRHLQPGQRATIHVDAWPDTPLKGKAHSIAGGTGASFSLLPPNNATGNFVKVVQRVPVRPVLTKPSPVPLQAACRWRWWCIPSEANRWNSRSGWRISPVPCFDKCIGIFSGEPVLHAARLRRHESGKAVPGASAIGAS